MTKALHSRSSGDGAGAASDAFCSSLRFHPLLGPGVRRRKGQEKDGAMGPLDLGFSHGFQSPRSAMGTAQRDWQGTEISQPSSPADKEGML